MALWGEKCVRCGEQRTRHTYEGLPTCEGCEEALRARIKADAETPRRCLVDGQVMTKEIVLNLGERNEDLVAQQRRGIVGPPQVLTTQAFHSPPFRASTSTTRHRSSRSER